MIKIDDKSKCCGCSACMSRCPKGCISFVSDEEGFPYPQVNVDNCTNCHLCEKVCPINNRELERDGLPVSYAAFSKNKDILNESSSGGVFTELATYIIEQGGYVCGVVCDKDLIVRHIIVSDVDGLKSMRGSKYVQSEINGIFHKIYVLLKNGKTVLFTGTPCQVAGIKKAIPIALQDRLLTLDFVCHGVPSPKVWEKYLDFRISQSGEGEISSASFRSKKHGWRSFCMLINFKNKNRGVFPGKGLVYAVFPQEC